MLNAPGYPHFQCPNCRANADLEADIDEPLSDFEEEWEEAPEEVQEKDTVAGAPSSAAEHPTIRTSDSTDEDADGAGETSVTALASHVEGISLRPNDQPPSPVSATNLSIPRATPIPIGPASSISTGTTSSSASPPGSAAQYALAREETAAPDGPMTPRNDAGPFLLNGTVGRSEGRNGMSNLESIVQEE